MPPEPSSTERSSIIEEILARGLDGITTGRIPPHPIPEPAIVPIDPRFTIWNDLANFIPMSPTINPPVEEIPKPEEPTEEEEPSEEHYCYHRGCNSTDTEYFSGIDRWLCDYHVFRCVHCDQTLDISEHWRDNICYDCADEYFVCHSCEGVYHVDEAVTRGDYDYCASCARDEEASYVHPYHHFNRDPVFLSSPSEKTSNPLFLGVELETDGYDSRSLAAEQLHDLSNNEELFHLEEDGSLDFGIEIISAPATLQYHEQCFPWKDIAQTVLQNGGKSHDTTTCGLHVHFNKSFFQSKHALPQVKLIYLFEKFWLQFVSFSRRGSPSSSNLSHNAAKYGCSMFDIGSEAKIEQLHNNYSRYQAVNIKNYRTIEIRICRGTLNVPTIYASLELVDFLARLVKKESTKKLQLLSWEGLLEKINPKLYPNLVSYLKKRNLWTLPPCQPALPSKEMQQPYNFSVERGEQ